MQNKEIGEALSDFKREYESCDHNNSDLIIELETAENILQYIDQLENKLKEVEQVRDKLECMDYYCTTEALEDLDKILQGEKGK